MGQIIVREGMMLGSLNALEEFGVQTTKLSTSPNHERNFVFVTNHLWAGLFVVDATIKR